MITDLRIYYDGGEVNTELEAALETLLADFGLSRWASGMEPASGKRDLAFERKKEEK